MLTMAIDAPFATDSNSSAEAALEISAYGRQTRGLIVALPAGFDAIIGRTDTATLWLDDDGVSREHARLVHDARGVVLTDLGSTNGTHVNGKRINEPVLLRDGDVVNLGPVSALFRASRSAQPGHEAAGESVHDGRPAWPGPLTPEAPISEPSHTSRGTEAVTPRLPVVDSGHAGDRRLGRAGEFSGTVLNVVPPVVNENPWLVLDIRTESGETVAVRARFFWGAIRAPYVAEGHYVRVAGRTTRRGYIKPRYIINESTGSQWRRSRLLPLAFLGVGLILAGLLLARVVAMNGTTGNNSGMKTVPDVVGESISQAVADIRGAGFGNVIQTAQKGGATAFIVTRTNPQPGTEVSTSSRVEIFFSVPF
jgi:hypothetical protein